MSARRGLGLASLALACIALVACGGAAAGTTASGGSRASHATQPGRSSIRARAAATTTGAAAAGPAARTVRARRKPPRRSPGSLPQTHQLPSAGTAVFRTEMAALWQGVRTGSISAAMPAFFPADAYAQVKAIADPRADWNARLVSEYRLDIGAAHALLGRSAAQARLVDVRVPSSYAHWVPTGGCYNRVGDWEVPNARLVYRAGGAERSFGIASMISWRGVWYVVHLGAVLRSGSGGAVDDPSAGPGASAPSSTC